MTDAPVLVMHAAGLDARCADFLGIPGAIRVTLPGHGDRMPAKSDLTLEAMADEVAGWIHEPVHIVGLSMGAMVAQHVALTHPDRVRSLVLACTTARTPTHVLLDRAEATARSSVGEILAMTLPRWFTESFLALQPEPPGLTYARECLSNIDRDSFAAVWRALAGHDVLDRLAAITAPTTCLAGTHDVSTPPAELAAMAERLPRARLVEIDAPHMALLEVPEAFRAVVEDHLDWVRAEQSREG